MPRNNFVFVYVTLICFKSVSLSPITVVSESTVLDDQAQHKNTDAYGVNSQKGISGGRYASGFSQENEKKHTAAQDNGAYNKVNNDRSSHEDAAQHFDEKAHRENAGSASQFGREGGHRKGHHKSGFQNSYHKEESENNSSYYDDNDDQGRHFVHDSRDGGFSSAGSDRNRGSRTDGHLYSKGNAQRGGYDLGGNYDKVQADRNGYNQKGFYDNHHNQGKQNAANAQGGSGRHVESNYYNQQPQYYPKYEPRRTITIYEDPRDLYPGSGYDSYRGYEPYDAELVHLNFRPNPYYPNNYDGY